MQNQGIQKLVGNNSPIILNKDNVDSLIKSVKTLLKEGKVEVYKPEEGQWKLCSETRFDGIVKVENGVIINFNGYKDIVPYSGSSTFRLLGDKGVCVSDGNNGGPYYLRAYLKKESQQKKTL